MLKYKSKWDYVFEAFNYTILALCGLACLLPFVHVVVSSFTSAHEILAKGFVLFPSEPTLDAYRFIFSTSTIARSISVSIYITIVGTAINMFMSLTMAYALSYDRLVGKKYINALIVFSMLFSGGMIPNYILIKNLGMIDSFNSLLIPGAISAFNLIIIKNFFIQIPKELKESAKIDGANEIQTLWSIILPVSMPTIATFTLFYAVGHWNTFFSAILYLNDPKKWPIQVILRNIVILSQGAVGERGEMDPNVVIPPESIKMAVIVVATIPILCVYPFLQKHFTKGVMVGSVKG